MQKNSSVTSYRQQLREKILKISMEEFKSKGIRAVKMDDIAALLGISKRTLYEMNCCLSVLSFKRDNMTHIWHPLKRTRLTMLLIS